MDFNKILESDTLKIADSSCIVNGTLMNLNEVQKMGYSGFSVFAKLNMPLKLYKYFPNRTIALSDKVSDNAGINKNDQNIKTVNYSIQALKENTVFMQSPSLFDDVYDSDISLDYEEYEKYRLFEYCCRCQLNVKKDMTTIALGNALINAIVETYKSNGNLNSLFKRNPKHQIEELSNNIFISKLKIELSKNEDLGFALHEVINSDFESFSQNLQNTFRATCFSTTPYSQLMWGGTYADCHRGFCVEYTVLPGNPSYQKLYYNLFPMIYCKIRPNMTERLAEYQNKEPTEENMWDIYFYGALRKSIDWAFQNEWRLLIPMKTNQPNKNYCVPFFPITKVFLGNRMSKHARKEIIEICHKQNIPYVGVTRNPNYFEMQPCPNKCENCPKYTSTISNN